MDQSSYNNWDIGIKVLTVLGVAIGGIWAICSYRMTSEKEFRRPLWDTQLSLYFQAATSAGKIATLPEGKARDESVGEFWNLYYGPLAVVEDDEQVCEAMVDFGECLPKPGRVYAEEECDKPLVQHRSLLLANAVRRSIGADWNRKLDQLNTPPTESTCRLRVEPQGVEGLDRK